LLLALSGLGGWSKSHDLPAEAPPAAKVVTVVDENLFSVEHPEQFPLVSAIAHASAPEVVVTGVLNPDVARNVPVISPASGRVIGIYARLGDTVRKGQLLYLIARSK
jgi:cobalt-zinc-cadmium efflux system membrane fusion protein